MGACSLRVKMQRFADGSTSFWYGNAATRTFGRAHRHRPYQSNICRHSAKIKTKILVLAVTLQATYSRKLDAFGTMQTMYSRKLGAFGALQAMYSRKLDAFGTMQTEYSRKLDAFGALQAMYSRKLDAFGALQAMYSRKLDAFGTIKKYSRAVAGAFITKTFNK